MRRRGRAPSKDTIITDLIAPTIAITISRIWRTDPHTGAVAQRLAGIGLFHLVEQAPGEFDATIAVQTAPAGSKLHHAALIRWLADQLLEPAMLVGWRLADGVVPALLAAAANASPHEHRAFVDALALAVGTGAIDLADRFGGAAAPSFHAVCKASTIPTIEPLAEMLSEQGPVRDQAISAMIAANAAATMRLWANGSPERAAALHDLAVGTLDAWRAVAADEASR